MRLRRKPWIDEAIKEYSDFLYLELPVENKGKWKEQFAEPEHPLCVELGTGKGRFISQMAAAHPEWNFVGFERQIGVIYYAGKKVAELDPPVNNVRLVLGDISHIEELFTPGEVDRFFINFCDPWPKARHEKRRLTHRNYLKRYAALLAPEGEICFKTDNRDLFDFSIEEFKAMGWELSDVNYDLHANPIEGDVMTEYEEKFSRKGNKICRLIARRPVKTELNSSEQD